MNILTEKLPDSVFVEGKEYPVNTDFRVWIRLALMLDRKDIPAEEKFFGACRLCFDFERKKELPDNFKSTVEALVSFFTEGNNTEKSQNNQSADNRVYDFSCDSGYIYAAFLECYGIDLIRIEQLHWFSFSALFKALPKSCKMVEIMMYRGADISKLSGEEKKYYSEMKELYALPDNRTREEKDSAIVECFETLF